MLLATGGRRMKKFGRPVDLSAPEVVRAVAGKVVGFVTIQTFVKELRKVVVEEREPELVTAARPLSATPGFPWSRPTVASAKCVFTVCPCDNQYEAAFARFLHDAADVDRFAKLPGPFGFVIEYTDGAGNLRHYEPDFAAVDAAGRHFLIETKGQEDIHVTHKDRAAALWAENATALTGTPWAYLKVRQPFFEKLRPDTLADLLAALPVG